MPQAGERWRLGRRPGLDGLRGLAIASVLLAHFEPNGWNTGSVGVAMFFGLSGFLITALIVEEHDRTGRFSATAFYARRARRLLPALIVYLTAWATFSTFIDVPGFDLSPLAVIGAVFYFSNWLMALGWGMPYPTAITWSLSIEEQFYLLWPVALVVSRRWQHGPESVAALGIFTAVLLRISSWSGPDSGWVIYHRSDTRMDSLLVGCLFALVVSRTGDFRRLKMPVGCIGATALVVLMLIGDLRLLYLGEPLLAPLATCGLIASVLSGGSRWLAWAPLRYLGRRSYPLYLWHFPLATLANKDYDRIPVWLAIGMALTAAEASWWLVERPFMKRPGEQKWAAASNLCGTRT